ncbi:hypothetical protein V500_06444 [Pseudogymnoascus sp. VKM F-4518 (FW-2643)]|nr:hypothetical protein V500_06444 [Pseudogymnoascus sp. VKM F-4518 (FW-2643)]
MDPIVLSSIGLCLVPSFSPSSRSLAPSRLPAPRSCFLPSSRPRSFPNATPPPPRSFPPNPLVSLEIVRRNSHKPHPHPHGQKRHNPPPQSHARSGYSHTGIPALGWAGGGDGGGGARGVGGLDDGDVGDSLDVAVGGGGGGDAGGGDGGGDGGGGVGVGVGGEEGGAGGGGGGG